MNRSGRSRPAGPASTPQASSGWSARAWATILSYSARGIVSTSKEHTGAPPSRAKGARASPGLKSDALASQRAAGGCLPREPKGRGPVWTEERRRSDEGRRDLKAARRRAREQSATKEGGASKAPRRRAGGKK